MKKTLLTTAAILAISTGAHAGHHEKGDYKHKDHMHKKYEIVMAADVKKQHGVDYTVTEAIGQAVQGKNGEKLGDVQNMGLSQKGKVKYVVVNLDGMVMNDEIAIPYKKFGWNEKDNALTLDMTKEELAKKAEMLSEKK